MEGCSWSVAENGVAFKLCSAGIKGPYVCQETQLTELHHHHQFVPVWLDRSRIQQRNSSHSTINILQHKSGAVDTIQSCRFGEHMYSVASFPSY